MKIENNCVSFQSKIKLITPLEFNNMTKNLSPKKHEVRWPWTADTMKSGKKLFTTGIMNCIAVCLIDGKKAVLAHLATYNQRKAKDTHQRGFNIENAKRRLLEKMNLESENLHAIILGGFQLRPDDKNNAKQLSKIKKLFEENNIPYTIFGARKDVHYFGKYSIFYSNKEDTCYITNNLIGERALNGNGKEIDIKNNAVEYNTYQRQYAKNGLGYKSIRKLTDTKEFFQSQFRDVSISQFDELI